MWKSVPLPSIQLADPGVEFLRFFKSLKICFTVDRADVRAFWLLQFLSKWVFWLAEGTSILQLLQPVSTAHTLTLKAKSASVCYGGYFGFTSTLHPSLYTVSIEGQYLLSTLLKYMICWLRNNKRNPEGCDISLQYFTFFHTNPVSPCFGFVFRCLHIKWDNWNDFYSKAIRLRGKFQLHFKGRSRLYGCGVFEPQSAIKE